MRSLSIAALVAAAACAAAPAAAQEDGRLPAEMREMANSTSGVTIANGVAADKVVHFGRGQGGALTITGYAALAPGGSLDEVPAEAVAVLRTRARSGNGNATPEPGDFDLVRRSGVPLFVVGEWRTPPVLWEVRRRGDGVAWREIGADGRAGDWTQPPS